MKEASSAQQGCIYLIENTVKTVKYYYNLKSLFLCEYLLNCNLFLWSKLNFQHHYSSLQCHMIFRNNSNMLICCSRNISDYYQMLKTVMLNIFVDFFFFPRFFDNRNFLQIVKIIYNISGFDYFLARFFLVCSKSKVWIYLCVSYDRYDSSVMCGADVWRTASEAHEYVSLTGSSKSLIL